MKREKGRCSCLSQIVRKGTTDENGRDYWYLSSSSYFIMMVGVIIGLMPFVKV